MGKTQQLRISEATFPTCTKQERTPGLQLGEKRTTASITRTCENIRMPVSWSRLELHARAQLVENQWSWETWGINPEQHGRTWPVTWRELGPQSPWLPLVTQYTVMDYNPAAHVRFPLSHQHMCRPVWSLPGPSGWTRGGMGEGPVVRWDQNRTFWYKFHLPYSEEEEGWVQFSEPQPKCVAWRLRGAFLQTERDHCTVLQRQ